MHQIVLYHTYHTQCILILQYNVLSCFSFAFMNFSLQDVKTYSHVLRRWGHSAAVVTLCPDIEGIVVYGGISEDYNDGEDPRRSNVSNYNKTSDTTIILFSELM